MQVKVSACMSHVHLGYVGVLHVQLGYVGVLRVWMHGA